MMDTTQQAHITSLHIKGYKSIRDTYGEFLPGLNIIIGQNGSGKTNLMEILEGCFEKKVGDLEVRSNFEAKIEGYYFLISSFNLEEWINKQYFFVKALPVKMPFGDNDQQFQKHNRISYSINEEEMDWIHTPNYLKFGIPENLPFVSPTDLNIVIEKIGEKKFIMPAKDIWETQFMILFFASVFRTIDYTEQPLTPYLKIKSELKEALARFTPIKDIEIETKRIDEVKQYDEIKLQNIRFRFFVNGEWWTWQNLSDGTKRMYYLIASMVYSDGIIMMEEPELGIHPHQLHLLMTFIKELSETRQIILTTHSPQVLDFLAIDELDRITICKMTAEGTKLEKLTEEKKRIAARYMSEVGYLSEYWLKDTLENLPENDQ